MKEKARNALRSGVSRFVKQEDGSMTNLTVAAAVAMIAFGGLGIDMMHAELSRAKIQATLDRSVLAAADLENVLVPGDVVYDYFAKMGVSNALTGVQVEQAANYKIVSAQAALTHDANFSNIIGVDRFDIGGHSKAQEWVDYVEVALVLDISGSMGENDRLTNMQDAANLFIDTVVDPNFPESVAITIVPYSEHVNAGAIADRLNIDRAHDYSNCVEIPDSEYNNTAFNTSRSYTQMQHYQWNYFGANNLDTPVCPNQAFAEIQAVSNDVTSLKAQIAAFVPQAGTSIFMGMKWAAGLLHPSMRTIVSGLISDGEVPAAMSGRPFDLDRDDVGKHIVMMTDGKHDKSYRIQDWAYAEPSMYAHWNENNLWNFNVNNVTDAWSWADFYVQRYSAGYGDALLDRICDAAKDDGITIWAVAFETDSAGANVLEQCASSPAHFYDAEGTELQDVFYAIARAISQLRLVE